MELDKYINEVLGSMLEEDYAIFDEFILDAFNERTVIVTALSTPAQITGEEEGGGGGVGGVEEGGGGLSFRLTILTFPYWVKSLQIRYCQF